MAYGSFQILIEESNRAIHGGGEVFGDVVVVAIVGVQVGNAAHSADFLRQANGKGQGHVFICGAVVQLQGSGKIADVSVG